MQKIYFVVFLVFAVFFVSCSEDLVEPTVEKLFEGSWQGTLNGTSLEITFIEGGFEGSPTVTGTANLNNKNDSLYYQVRSGTIVRKSKVWFALNKVPEVEKEEYHMEGTVSGTWINGIYEKLSQSGEIMETGTWNVQRLP